MTFAVFGVNKVKCRDAAFKFIQDMEGKPIAVLRTEVTFGGQLGKHFENVVNGVTDPDQFERALKERIAVLCASAKWTAISAKYDSPAAAIEYLERLNSAGDLGIIKQQCGVTDGEGMAEFTKNGKKQKLEWRDFDTHTMKVKKK